MYNSEHFDVAIFQYIYQPNLIKAYVHESSTSPENMQVDTAHLK